MAKRIAQKTATSRRAFLKGGAAASAGLVIGFYMPSGAANADDAVFMPNAFLQIGRDNSVTVICKHIEFGQGIYTGLATILADELDADWSQVRVVSAPADARFYNNLLWGPVQGTGGSSSIVNSWLQLRRAGATARLMLIQAAADEWHVPVGEVKASRSVLMHAISKRSASYGAMAEKAARVLAPWVVNLKEPNQFTLIGKSQARLDTAAKTDGSAVYTMDVRRLGMLTAVLARPPRFGGKVKSFDAATAKKIPGVVDVVAIPLGVAVLASGFWAAKNGRDALKIEWDENAAEKRGSKELLAEYRSLLDKTGLSMRKDGDPDAAIAGAAKTFAADYEFPFLAHAPMEPLNCVVELSAERCEIWSGSQLQSIDQRAAAIISGLSPAQVQIHTLMAGGSFGRRGSTDADLVAEAVMIAKAIGGRAPVHLVWTREDDIRGGYYRPLYVHRLRAGLDGTGRIIGWHHRIVGQPVANNGRNAQGVDSGTVEGAINLPYAIGALDIETHAIGAGIPTLWWRAPGSSHNAYATETFLDELATATDKDPVQFRLSMLTQKPRPAEVLKLAAEKSGWGRTPAQGRFRGVALHEWAGTFVAQVAEISFNKDAVKVERVICAVDCGTTINPDVVIAQMEGGIGYGLGAALYNAITLTGGKVDQSNFHDYKPLRIADMPRIEVHIVASSAPPTGVGEAGVPPIAPAVANAIFAATGRRIRALPFNI